MLLLDHPRELAVTLDVFEITELIVHLATVKSVKWAVSVMVTDACVDVDPATQKQRSSILFPWRNRN